MIVLLDFGFLECSSSPEFEDRVGGGQLDSVSIHGLKSIKHARNGCSVYLSSPLRSHHI